MRDFTADDDLVFDPLEPATWGAGATTAPDYSVTEQEYRERLAGISGASYPDFLDPADTSSPAPTSTSTLSAGSLAEALQKGLDNLTDGVTSAVKGSPGLTLSLIPWWLKAAVAFYVLFLLLKK